MYLHEVFKLSSCFQHYHLFLSFFFLFFHEIFNLLVELRFRFWAFVCGQGNLILWIVLRNVERRQYKVRVSTVSIVFRRNIINFVKFYLLLLVCIDVVNSLEQNWIQSFHVFFNFFKFLTSQFGVVVRGHRGLLDLNHFNLFWFLTLDLRSLRLCLLLKLILDLNLMIIRILLIFYFFYLNHAVVLVRFSLIFLSL